jgi:hypothetical protein
MTIVFKALYAITFSIVIFPNHTWIGHTIFAGGLFIFSLIPDPEKDSMPKKAKIWLSILLLTITTAFVARAIYEATNVPIVLISYTVLVTLISWKIRNEIKAKP